MKLWKLAQHACQLKHLEETFHCDSMKFTVSVPVLYPPLNKHPLSNKRSPQVSFFEKRPYSSKYPILIRQ